MAPKPESTQIETMKTTIWAFGMIATIAFSATTFDDTATGPETTDRNFVRGGLPQNSMPMNVDIVQTEDREFDGLETLVVPLRRRGYALRQSPVHGVSASGRRLR
jgi:hypothetical protein